VLMLITAGALSLALFVVIELELDEPLIQLRVLKHWPFVNSLLLISVLSVGLAGDPVLPAAVPAEQPRHAGVQDRPGHAPGIAGDGVHHAVRRRLYDKDRGTAAPP